MGQRLWLAVSIICAVTAGVVGHSCLINGQHHNGHLTVPDGTASISHSKYHNCDGITGVTFNTDGSLKEIRYQAFLSADGIKNVTIPASVTSIENQAFGHCDNFELVAFEAGSSSQLESIGYVSFFCVYGGKSSLKYSLLCSLRLF